MKNVTKKDLQDQLKVKAEVNSKLKSQIEELQTLISDKDKELTELTDCLKIEKSSNDKLGNKLADIKNINSSLVDKVNKLETEVAAKDVVINNLTEKLNNANEVAAHYEQLADNTYNDCKAELASVYKQLETKTIDFNNLNDIKVKLEADLEYVTQIKNIADDQAVRYAELNSKLEVELNQTKSVNNSLTNKVKELDNKLSLQISDNHELKRKVKAHDTMSIVFGLVAVLAILGCIIFG